MTTAPLASTPPPVSVKVSAWPVASSVPVTVSATLSVSENWPEVLEKEPSVLMTLDPSVKSAWPSEEPVSSFARITPALASMPFRRPKH